jgi:HAD superfamily hydrolase (TIGR01450 family)
LTLIVVGDYRDRFTFDTMNKALRLLLKGAKLIGMSPELIDRSMGDYELNVGSWVHMLEKASNVQAVYVGKPSPYMFELALQHMRLENREVVMVGDKVSTDIQGAHNVGIRSILVKTGEFDEKDLKNGVKPDFVCDSIKDTTDIFDLQQISE